MAGHLMTGHRLNWQLGVYCQPFFCQLLCGHDRKALRGTHPRILRTMRKGGVSMYTGIVQAMCPLTFVERAPNLMRFGITLPPAIADEVTLGASIAINGCCFTVTPVWLNKRKG